MTPAAAASSGDGISHFVFDSCLSGCDCEINRRPYHRNCECALHKPRNKNGLRRAESCSGVKVAFPIRRSGSEGCLTAYASSPLNSSPVNVKMGRRKVSMDTLAELCVEEADQPK